MDVAALLRSFMMTRTFLLYERRHKKWLAEFKAQKAAEAQLSIKELEDEAQMKERLRISQSEARALIRGVKAEIQQIEEPRYEPVDYCKLKPEPAATIVTCPQPPKKVAVPAWALSEQANEGLEEGQVDELLEFTNNLDFEKFIDDMEVREALKVVNSI